MSQNWTTLLTSHTLAASRSYLNENFETLRSSWAGSSAPASPVDGQIFLNTSDWKFYVYANSAWRQIGTANAQFLGLLPRSAGSSYPLSGDLYCGGYKVKSVGAPQDANDLVTKTWAENVLIDTNNVHDGTSGKGPRIEFADLDTTGPDAWSFLQSNAANGAVGREWGENDTTGSLGLTGSYQDLASVTVHAETNEPKLILYGCYVDDGGMGPITLHFRAQRNTTTIGSEMTRTINGNLQVAYGLLNAPTSGADYSWKLQAYGSGLTAYQRFIVVL